MYACFNFPGYVSLMTLNCNDFQITGRVEKDHEIANNVIDPTTLSKYEIHLSFIFSFI